MRLVEVIVRSGNARSAVLDFVRHQLSVDFADRSNSRAEAARILGESIRLASMPVRPGQIFAPLPESGGWDACAIFSDHSRDTSAWWWTETGKGRIRIDGASMGSDGVDPDLWADLIPGVRSAKSSRRSRTVVLRVDPERSNLREIVETIDTLCRKVSTIEEDEFGPEDRHPLSNIAPVARAMHLGLAGVTLSMAVAGVLVPGVPTVPFVLMTSYHLSKGSLTMHQAFRRMPLFGSLGEDWTNGRFIRSTNKIWLITISTGVLILSLTMTQVSGIALATIATIYTLTTTSVLVMPGHPRPVALPRVTSSHLARMLPV